MATPCRRGTVKLARGGEPGDPCCRRAMAPTALEAGRSVPADSGDEYAVVLPVSASESQSGARRSITLDHVVDAPLRLYNRVIPPCPVQPRGFSVAGLIRRPGLGLCPIGQLAGRMGLGQTIGATGLVGGVWIPSRLVLVYQARALRLSNAPVPIHLRPQSSNQIASRVLDRWDGNQPNLGWTCLGYGGRRDVRHRRNRDCFGGWGRTRRRSECGVRDRR